MSNDELLELEKFLEEQLAFIEKERLRHNAYAIRSSETIKMLCDVQRQQILLKRREAKK